MRFEYETPEDFATSRLEGLASGDGMFVDTPFTVPVGRSFVALIRIASTGEEIDLPCEVVSSNLGSDRSTVGMGMGLVFRGLSEDRLSRLRALRAAGSAGPDEASAADEATDEAADATSAS